MSSVPVFRYLRWFKERIGRARISLASSGMSLPPEDVFPIHSMEFTLALSEVVDHPPLRHAIAARLGVGEERVAVVPGCTYASHLAVRTLLEPGATAAVENPTYELLVRLAELSGARIRRIQRPLDQGFALPMDRIEEIFSEESGALLITAPHNPSGYLPTDAEVGELAALAEALDFHVMADEVYIDYHARPTRPYTSLAAVSDRFIVSGSLTKVQGLGNLRLGWIAGPPAFIERARRLNEYLADRVPAFDAQAGLLAFDCLEQLNARAHAVRRANWPLVQAWAGTRPGVGIVDCGAGINCVLQVDDGIDTLALAEDLLDREGVLLVPAEMFGGRGFLRLSFGVPRDALAEGLCALDRTLARVSLSP